MYRNELPDLQPIPWVAARARREQGAALLVTMLLMALMGLIGLASLDTVQRDRQITGHHGLAQTALYASDAGIAHGLEILRTEIVGAALSPGDCLGTQIPSTSLNNGASYVADSAAPNICMLASANPCAEIDASIESGQPIYLYTVWNVRAEGTAPGGATANIHATAERCHAFNN